MKAPFPWAGGKSRVTDIVWPRFGDVPNYVEPFFGSGAVLLGRPFPVRVETVNDADCYLANFWRALQHEPEAVAHYADWPVNEADLHARHLWLVNQTDFRERMMSDPDYCDAKIAGWWVWGLSAWIGSGWCDTSEYERNKGKRPNLPQRGGRGVHRLKNSGRPNLRPHQGVEGVPQQVPRSIAAQGVHAKSLPVQIPRLRDNGRGVNRPNQQLPHLKGDSGASGQGVNAGYVRNDLYAYMQALSERLRRVRVCCGDWSRIMGRSVTYLIGITGVFLDPPYPKNQERYHVWLKHFLESGPEPEDNYMSTNRTDGLYSNDSQDVDRMVAEVYVWCVENGDNPKLRIALCGYDGEHNELEDLGWSVIAWKANGGYANQRKNGTNDNSKKERIWFSPHCLGPLDDIMTGRKARVTDFTDLPIFQKDGNQ